MNEQETVSTRSSSSGSSSLSLSSLSSIGFSSIDSQFNDPRDVTCVTLILQFIGDFLPFIESTRLNLERITEAIVCELIILRSSLQTGMALQVLQMLKKN